MRKRFFKKKFSGLKKGLSSTPFFRDKQLPLSCSVYEMKGALSTKYNYFYSRIPKAANTTVVASLYYLETGERLDDRTACGHIKDTYFRKLSSLTESELHLVEELYKFTFVRSPYGRFYSVFQNKVKRVSASQRIRVARALGKEIDAKISVDEFLNYLDNGGILQNGHWARQSDLLVFPVERYNRIGKMENLADDASLIFNQIYGRSELVNVDSHRSKIRDLSDLSHDQLSRVYKLYEKDFDFFCYPTEPTLDAGSG